MYESALFFCFRAKIQKLFCFAQSHFDRIIMDYTDHEVSGLLSGFIDERRTRLIAKAVQSAKTILDIGCGNGLLIPHLSSSVSYCGIDINQEIITYLKERYPHFKFLSCRAGVEKLPLFSDPFNAVVLAGFVEHIESSLHLNLLKNIRELLQKDGMVILTTPTVFGGRVHKWLAFMGLASKAAAQEHKCFLSKGELLCLLKTAGFKSIVHHYYFCGLAQFVSAKLT